MSKSVRHFLDISELPLGALASELQSSLVPDVDLNVSA